VGVETVQPSDYAIRSFHYRTLIRGGARFYALADAAIALDYSRTRDEEQAQARRLGLTELSPLPRTGFKGREAIAWLRRQGLTIGNENNRAWVQGQSHDPVVARLADTEALILSDLGAEVGLCARLERICATERPPGCYHVPRRDSSAWFAVTGEYAGSMFAKLCGVDLRHSKFSVGSVAQTSMARMNVIVIRSDLGDTPVFFLIFDSASADYLWRCLIDAMAEFDGAPVGHAAVLSL
jgi:sarcosine oxidase subunit gamma